MRKLKEITNDEMVGIFLQAEINSNRWSKTLKEFLDRDQKPVTLLQNPDYTNIEENEYRRKLLGEFRGYGNNSYLFEHFPTSIHWQRVLLSKEELKKIKYMNYSYWNELSGHTRLASKGAENVLNGIEVFGESNKGFIDAADAVKNGIKFPPIILVAQNTDSDLVVLEGHQRITAYLMAYEYMRDELEVIIGYSEEIIRWGSY